MHSAPITTSFPKLPPAVSSSLETFDETYLRALESGAPTVARALEHLQKGKGKQIRPLIIFLVAYALGADSDEGKRENAMNGAISIELLHLASLIHDDVIDESPMRRGQSSFYSLLGPHKAVLMGDYILSHAFMRALLIGSKALPMTLADLGRQLSEGELLQEDFSELSLTTEEQYFEVIRRKTASLIRTAFRVGAEAAGVADPGTLETLDEASEKIGLAFQIKDDIFDYMPTSDLGKPAGNDLKEHKVTLPLIFALSTDTADARKGAKLLKKKDLNHEEIRFLLVLARKSGGIEYAQGRMARFTEEAKELLRAALPPSEYLDALVSVTDYIVMREK